MVSRIKLGIWEAEEFEQDLASRHTTFGRSTSASDMQRKGNRHSEEHNKQGEVSSRNSTDKSRICYTVIILLRLDAVESNLEIFERSLTIVQTVRTCLYHIIELTPLAPSPV